MFAKEQKEGEKTEVSFFGWAAERFWVGVGWFAKERKRRRAGDG
jgi:hypothetical protein